MPRQPIDRRTFLRRAAGTAVAVPSLSAVLAACAKPGALPPGVELLPLARPDKPVTLPMWRDPIPDGMPIEKGATLKIYNWDSYFYKKVLKEFEALYDVTIEWTPFNNMEEAIQKMASGQVKPDVFFSDVDKINSLVESRIIQPLNQSYIPNLEKDAWRSYQDPFYDQGWRYTVPYVIWTTGVGYRRDHIDDSVVADKGFDVLWDPQYAGKIGLYDSYRDTIGMALIRNGVTDINTGNPEDIRKAKDDILDLIAATDARLTINGTYVGIPEDTFWAHLAWSGDMVGATFYLPKGTDADVLGYWHPPRAAAGNDTMTVTSYAQNPVLAHTFLNFMLDPKYGVPNFTQWNGYQPPLKAIDPDTLVKEGTVPESLSKAVVQASDVTHGLFINALSPEVDQRWVDAWAEIKAGG